MQKRAQQSLSRQIVWHKETWARRWPDLADGPYLLDLDFEFTMGAIQCVGFRLESKEDDPAQPWAPHLPITPKLLRDIKLGELTQEFAEKESARLRAAYGDGSKTAALVESLGSTPVERAAAIYHSQQLRGNLAHRKAVAAQMGVTIAAAGQLLHRATRQGLIPPATGRDGSTGRKGTRRRAPKESK